MSLKLNILAVLACSVILTSISLIAIGLYFRPSQELQVADYTGTPNPNLKCTRSEPYETDPAISRALSLIKQRFEEAEADGAETSEDTDDSNGWINCVNIRFADLDSMGIEGAEGVFYLDRTSSIAHIPIYIDESYKLKDDLLTAVLLVHELVHADNYIKSLLNGNKLSCIEEEVSAFDGQQVFISWLTPEEKRSLNTRLLSYAQGGYDNDERAKATISTLEALVRAVSGSSQYCKTRYTIDSDEYHECVANQDQQGIRNMVTSNRGYRKLCGLD